MRIFFYFGHPAQFHFYKNLVGVLKAKGHEIFLYIKTKDVLQDLVLETGWEFKNILPVERGKSKASIISAILKRDFLVAREVMRHKPDLLIASDPSFSHIGWLFGIPCINCNDDDVDAAGYYAMVTYPFTRTILTPHTVRIGRWEKKRVVYRGYMKLAYLHPNWFAPDEKKLGGLVKKEYFIIRLSRLSAHHDAEIKGIRLEALREIISRLSKAGRVIISAEGELAREFEPLRMKIPVADMHHFLYYSKALVSDSQSMSGEAAMLGIPSVRISSFQGKLSVLDELENSYGLTFAFQPDKEAEIFEKIDELLGTPDLQKVFQDRREKMLGEKIDVTSFIIWFVENYPGSVNKVKDDPDFQFSFK